MTAFIILITSISNYKVGNYMTLCLNHTFPYSRAIYSNRSSDSRRPAQKGVYHCFPFFYSRTASFIHKHGHKISHRPFLSDLNKEIYQYFNLVENDTEKPQTRTNSDRLNLKTKKFNTEIGRHRFSTLFPVYCREANKAHSDGTS